MTAPPARAASKMVQARGPPVRYTWCSRPREKSGVIAGAATARVGLKYLI